MPIKTFTPGVLTASDVNTYLMNQSVITCTSSTRPGSPSEGMTIYETDTDMTRQYNGSSWVQITGLGAWSTWTPVFSGTGWTFTTVTNYSYYTRVGRIVICRLQVALTTIVAGTGRIMFTLPVTAAANATSNTPWGPARCNDVSASAPYYGFVGAENSDTTKATLFVGGASATYVTVNDVTGTVPMTFANGDEISSTFVYESAS